MSMPMNQMPQPQEDLDQGPISYANEDEEFLFGPTTRPNETFAMSARRGKPKRPKGLTAYQETLLQLAESPDAPRELLDFVRVMQYHMEGR